MNKVLVLHIITIINIINSEILYFDNNGSTENTKKIIPVEEKKNNNKESQEQSHLPLSSLFAQSSKYKCMKDDKQCNNGVNSVNGVNINNGKNDLPKVYYGPRFQNIHLALPQREIKEVGHKENITLNGRNMTLTTRSRHPHIIEISNFLSDNETELIIDMAKNKGLQQRKVHAVQVYLPDEITQYVFDKWDLDFDGHLSIEELYGILEMNPLMMTKDDIIIMLEKSKLDKDNNSYISYGELSNGGLLAMKTYLQEREVERAYTKSYNVKETWLWHDEDELLMYEDLLEDYHQRLNSITDIPVSLLEESEPIKVIKNEEQSFSYCQHDSKPSHDGLPCCVYGGHNCKICRYATVMMFLNDVESGGEVLFPLADNETFSWEHLKTDTLRKCSKIPNKELANLVIKPKRGSALLYYNHGISPYTGWMSSMIPESLIGSTQVKQGERWIAKMWIDIIGDGVKDLRPWKMGTNWLSENNKNKKIIEELRNDHFREGEVYLHKHRTTYRRNQTEDEEKVDAEVLPTLFEVKMKTEEEVKVNLVPEESLNVKLEEPATKEIEEGLKEVVEEETNSSNVDTKNKVKPQESDLKENKDIEKTKNDETLNILKSPVKGPVKPTTENLDIPLTSMGMFRDKPLKILQMAAKMNNHNNNNNNKKFDKRTEVPLGPPKLPLDPKPFRGSKVINNRVVKASLLLIDELERDELEIIARSLHEKLQLACIPLIVNPIGY